MDDLAKLQRLMRYVSMTKERGVVFSPGVTGIEVSVLIDAAYGVHPDGKSHTGSCVVISDVEAVYCKSAKQQIVTKSSTEAELVALSDSASQELRACAGTLMRARHYLSGQHVLHGADRSRTISGRAHQTYRTRRNAWTQEKQGWGTWERRKCMQIC